MQTIETRGNTGNGGSPMDKLGEDWEGAKPKHGLSDPALFLPPKEPRTVSTINPSWTDADQAAVDAAPHRQYGPNRVHTGVINYHGMYEKMKAARNW